MHFKSFHMSRLCLRIHHDASETNTDNTNARTNPQGLSSMPLMRFMPNNEAMSVGNMRMMLNEVIVRIVVLMLLLMTLV